MANRFLSNININDEYTLPSADGTADQIITTDGAGQLSFVDLNSIDGASSNFVYFDVKNETGSPILKGKGVMAVGTDGNSGHILIDEMVADGSVESKYFLGVLEEDIANGGFSRVISFGQLSQFDTRGQNGETWADGQVLWCDPANNGDFTITEPDGPNVKIAAAFILNSSTNGKIQVRVQANEGIHDLHDTKITSQVDGDVLVWDNTTGVWFNDNTLNVDYTNNRVGIGTTSPIGAVHILGPNTNSAMTTSSLVIEQSDGAKILIDGNDIDAAAGMLYLNDYSTNDVVFGGQIRVGGGGSPVGNSWFANGNVGIGTTSPTSKLHVTDSAPVLKLQSSSNTSSTVSFDNSSGTRRASLSFNETSDSLSLINESGSGLVIFTPSVGQFTIGPFAKTGVIITNQSLTLKSNYSTALTCDFAGNVGIGTTSPSAKLDVSSGDVQFDGGDFNVLNSTGSYGGRSIARFRNGADQIQFGDVEGYISGNTFDINYGSSICNFVKMNVGIDNASPSYLLDVSGDGRVNGTFRCVSLIQTSQRDQKTEIELVGKETTSLPIKRYKYKSGDDNKLRYGVVAEDIESSYPELVETDAEGIKGVKYIDFLVRKIAELETEKRTLVNWRHYHSNTSYNTLYDTGMTTAFPYAYGSIPAPYDMYFTSVTLVNNPYSSYNKGPEGDTATFQAYVNGKLAYEVRDIRYGQNPYESITADFGQNVRLRRGESLQIRFQANGIWRYCNSTIILTEI